MSKFLNVPVIGIDVSADFSFGAIYRKSFKINHDAEGFEYLLKESSHKSIIWCENTYTKLLKAAESALKIGFDTDLFKTTISINLDLIEMFDKQINRLLFQLENQIKSNDTPKSFRENVALLISFPGIGFITAVTLISEIGDLRLHDHMYLKNASTKVA